MNKIREEQPEDISQIYELHIKVFKGAEEARLINLLRHSGKEILSLVALQEKEVIGHILFSPMTFEPVQKHISAIGLAPVGVNPDYQNQGIGSNLIQTGIAKCRLRNYSVVFVLGAPGYYQRFGFRPASLFGIKNEYKVDDHFMALELITGTLDNLNATAKYSSEFAQLGI